MDILEADIAVENWLLKFVALFKIKSVGQIEGR